jgi:hypothetical protein
MRRARPLARSYDRRKLGDDAPSGLRISAVASKLENICALRILTLMIIAIGLRFDDIKREASERSATASCDEVIRGTSQDINERANYARFSYP